MAKKEETKTNDVEKALVAQEELSLSDLSELGLHDEFGNPIGLGEVEQGEYSIPIFKIIQPTTANGDPGKLFCEDLDDLQLDKIICSILLIQPQRIMWPENFDRDSDPVCRSRSGEVGISNAKELNGRYCDSCPYSKWENGERPRCNKGYMVVGKAYLPDKTTSPFQISVYGASVSTTRKLKGDIRRSKLPPCAYLMYISTEKEVGKQGTYYKISFEFDRKRILNTKEIKANLEMAKDYEALITGSNQMPSNANNDEKTVDIESSNQQEDEADIDEVPF